jgi:hypothetical protein
MFNIININIEVIDIKQKVFQYYIYSILHGDFHT